MNRKPTFAAGTERVTRLQSKSCPHRRETKRRIAVKRRQALDGQPGEIPGPIRLDLLLGRNAATPARAVGEENPSPILAHPLDRAAQGTPWTGCRSTDCRDGSRTPRCEAAHPNQMEPRK